MTFYIAQGVSVLAGITAVVTTQLKGMKKILIGHILANLFTALTYFLLGGLSGAGICFIAIFQTFVMYLYNIKNVKPHKSVIFGFIAMYIACSAFYYGSFIDVVSAVAAVCYAFSVVQTKPSLSRLWYLFNPLCWLIYDIYTRAYANIVLHAVIFISTFTAIVRYDIRKKEKA